MARTAVYLLFIETNVVTTIWASNRVFKILRKHDKQGLFLERIRRFAQDGFALWQGPDRPIRAEWNEVYRIGHPSTLFRLIGFYVGGQSCFVACDAFLKSGQKLGREERQRVNEVARIRAEGDWYKEKE